MLSMWLCEQIAHVGTQRPCQDKGRPEQHGAAYFGEEVEQGDECYEAKKKQTPPAKPVPSLVQSPSACPIFEKRMVSQ